MFDGWFNFAGNELSKLGAWQPHAQVRIALVTPEPRKTRRSAPLTTTSGAMANRSRICRSHDSAISPARSMAAAGLPALKDGAGLTPTTSSATDRLSPSGACRGSVGTSVTSLSVESGRCGSSATNTYRPRGESASPSTAPSGQQVQRHTAQCTSRPTGHCGARMAYPSGSVMHWSSPRTSGALSARIGARSTSTIATTREG